MSQSDADADAAKATREEILAAQQEFEQEVKRNEKTLYIAPKVKYRYALALSKSDEAADWLLARCYFNDLCKVGHDVRRCRLEVAKLHLKLGDFRKCRKLCQELMALPTSGTGDDEADLEEVEHLHAEVVNRVYKEGKIGIAAVVAIAVLFGGLVAWSFRGPASNNTSKETQSTN